MNVYPHNQLAINNILALLNSKSKVCVVHPTGTGKAVIIAQLLNHFSTRKNIVIGPTTLIETEIRKHTQKDFIFYTFKALELMSDEDISNVFFDNLIIDEFHRIGAKEWNRIIKEIESNNIKSKFIGFSATPIRYLDNNRDMAQEFFDGNIASYISLVQAIKANILPLPRYVSAIYSVDNEYRSLVKKIIGSNSHKIYTEKIHSAIINWEKASGLLSIFTKHLRSYDNKFIVFCSKVSEIEAARKKLTSIFQSIKGKVNSYTIISSNGYAQNNVLLKHFSDDDGPCLCFTVDMFNEAIHLDGIKGVDGVIQLRFTASPNIYYQQIGRCLSVNQFRQPIVFDLVNNFNSIIHSQFKGELEKEFLSNSNELPQIPIDARLGRATTNKDLINVSFFDETKEIRELFAKFSGEFDPWETQFALLEETIKKGQPITSKENTACFRFINSNRQKFRYGSLDPERAKRVQDLGIRLEVVSKNKWGMIKDGAVWNIPGTPLFNWMQHQRSRFLQSKLTEEEIIILRNAGLDLDSNLQKSFDDYLSEYKLYRLDISVTPMNKELKNWAKNQRNGYFKNRISAEHKQKLDEVGFIGYTDKDRQWELSLNKYTCGSIDKSILEWIRWQKVAFQDGFLKPWREEKLRAAGFDFTPTKITSWEETFELIKNNPKWEEVKALKKWRIEQGRRFREGCLSEEKTELLRSIGIHFSSVPFRAFNTHKSFEEHLEVYKQFLNDPAEPSMSKELKNWVANQRSKYNRGRLSTAQRHALDALGIMNKPVKERSWRLKFEDYKLGSRSSVLLEWASRQQKEYYKGTLEINRKEKLLAIGFNFNAISVII
ncbi:Helicase associated domain protein [Chitinophaga niabensis]|uniref:Superfamily II DNA or RNA helicase n=1 Tax=Chitinophaga niabensis TaxID=536979 RepID=A0A1N6KAW2_9BACT|nr:Helicase associated domain protein [Chitinophaga niabensis]SIO53476.1 Superfamily II DNA or RNA helicase [Chitinophaga niabensis]